VKQGKLRHRIWLILAGLFVFLPLAAFAGFIVSFNPNHYKPAIIRTLEAATGRNVTISGPIKLKLALNPTLNAEEVAIANPPGFANPIFVQADRLEATFSLSGLFSHRLNIFSLSIINPTITLAINKAGQSNWDISVPASSLATSTASGVAHASRKMKVTLQAVTIQNCRIILPGQATTITISSLTGQAMSASAPLHVSATANLNGTNLAVSGTTGPVERFSGIGTGLWPVDLDVQSTGLTGHIHGSIAHPTTGRGYDFQIKATASSLQTILSLLPARTLNLPLTPPPVQNLALSVQVTDQGTSLPALSDLSITAGKANLSQFMAGLQLSSASITMASLDQPFLITANGMAADIPLTLSSKAGAPALLLQAIPSPEAVQTPPSYPVSFQIQAGTATLSVNGAIATPDRLAGVALALNASIPDLSALGSAIGPDLPAWHNIIMQTTLTDPGGQGLVNAIGLDGLTVTMDHASFGGDGHIIFGKTPNIQIALEAQSIDADALRAAFPPAINLLPAAPAPAPALVAFVIPTTALPMEWLRSANGDVQVSINSLIFNQSTYTGIQAHAVLANHVLTLQPVSGELPGGAVTANATLDLTKEPAAAAVTIKAPALALAPTLKSLGLAPDAQGTLQASLTATGSGDNLHALAASMTGQAGLAMVNGIVDGQLLDQLFGAMLRSIGLPADLAGAHGPVPVRCFAFRLDAAAGTGTISTLTLDSTRLLIQGDGAVNFGTETLGVIIRPEMRVVNDELGVPVQIGGSFSAPTLSVMPQVNLKTTLKDAVGLSASIAQAASNPKTLAGAIANTVVQTPPPDVCPAALALGRLGQQGPAAAAQQPSPTATASPASGPKSLLNILFGK
jgi:AsmA protein